MDTRIYKQSQFYREPACRRQPPASCPRYLTPSSNLSLPATVTPRGCRSAQSRWAAPAGFIRWVNPPLRAGRDPGLGQELHPPASSSRQLTSPAALLSVILLAACQPCHCNPLYVVPPTPAVLLAASPLCVCRYFM